MARLSKTFLILTRAVFTWVVLLGLLSAGSGLLRPAITSPSQPEPTGLQGTLASGDPALPGQTPVIAPRTQDERSATGPQAFVLHQTPSADHPFTIGRTVATPGDITMPGRSYRNQEPRAPPRA